MKDINISDLVQMKKTHPCGSDKWEVIRVGADVKIKCKGCNRIIMLSRTEFEKKVKKILND
ncbi:DUF951 domain-containing protein [Clostridiaceae bacterium 14S0207]|nr:DUF951 domain-containing protein [Clostridiaceae bacterium 14S0207]